MVRPDGARRNSADDHPKAARRNRENSRASPMSASASRTLEFEPIGNTPSEFAAVIKTEGLKVGEGDQGSRDKPARLVVIRNYDFEVCQLAAMCCSLVCLWLRHSKSVDGLPLSGAAAVTNPSPAV